MLRRQSCILQDEKLGRASCTAFTGKTLRPLLTLPYSTRTIEKHTINKPLQHRSSVLGHAQSRCNRVDHRDWRRTVPCVPHPASPYDGDTLATEGGAIVQCSLRRNNLTLEPC